MMEKSFDEAYENYKELKEISPNHGKGIMDLIREDERLSKKITYEEAINRGYLTLKKEK